MILKRNIWKAYKSRICKKIRDEKKFESLDDLKKQIAKDVNTAKEQLLDEKIKDTLNLPKTGFSRKQFGSESQR